MHIRCSVKQSAIVIGCGTTAIQMQTLFGDHSRSLTVVNAYCCRAFAEPNRNQCKAINILLQHGIHLLNLIFRSGLLAKNLYLWQNCGNNM